MPKVILIFPELYDVGSCTRRGTRRDLAPPLGILTLAGVLLEYGVKVSIIDQRIDLSWRETLKREMQELPLFIGISTLTSMQIRHGLEIASFIKAHWNMPVIWGGVHPTLEPVSTAQHELVDIVVIGEGEKTVIELIDYFRGQRQLDSIKGIAFKCGNKIICKPRDEIVDLNSLPQIPFHLLQLDKYKTDNSHLGFKDSIIIPLETSRGCSYRCAFCRESVQPHKWRAMTPQKVVEHISNVISKYGIRTFAFYDDNFCVDPQRVEMIMELLEQERISIEWYTNMSPDYFLKSGLPALRRLEKSGCKSLTIGIESGSDQILRKIGKGVTVEEIFSINKNIAKTKIKAHYVAILGFPYDTLETIKQTYKMAIEVFIRNKRAMVGLIKLIPVPATRVLADCARKGFVVPKALEEWSIICNPRLVNYSQWLDERASRFMEDCNYLQELIGAARNWERWGGRLLFSIYAKIFLQRLKYDYFGLWIESRIFPIIFRNLRKIAALTYFN